jgi:hypothetical protein
MKPSDPNEQRLIDAIVRLNQPSTSESFEPGEQMEFLARWRESVRAESTPTMLAKVCAASEE